MGSGTFAPISTRAYEANLAAMRSGDAVIICETPIGPGNLLNLRAAVELESKTNIYILNPQSIGERDYTGGQATKLIHLLVESGAIPVEGVGELEKGLIARYHDRNDSVNRRLQSC